MNGILKNKILCALTLGTLCLSIGLGMGAYTTGMHVYTHKSARDGILNPEGHVVVQGEPENVTLDECEEVIETFSPIHKGLAYSSIAALAVAGVGIYVVESNYNENEKEEE